MKPGFGNKAKKKSKNKKAKKKNKGEDEAMKDVQPGTPVAKTTADGVTDGPTAKDKQRQRMELKKALKVTVAGLKSKRNKLTKLPGNKKPAEKKVISKQIQGLLQEQLLGKTGSSGHSKQQATPAAADEHAMAE